MFPSLLTVLLFACSITIAERSARMLGGMRANMARMTVSLLFLAAWAHSFGHGFGGPGFPWFFLSGIVGFGFGDLGLYLSLPRIGARLAILLCQCLAAPIGAAIEWGWLGSALGKGQIAFGLLILVGVIIALAPDSKEEPADRGRYLTGILLGFLAATGQALGAVLSRKAYQVTALAHWEVDGGTAAYERMLGGILLTVLIFVFARKGRLPEGTWKKARPWFVLNALTGPTLGVAAYQWALATTHTGIVLPIVAMSPVATIPMAYWITGECPGWRSIVGGLIAVAGAIGISLNL